VALGHYGVADLLQNVVRVLWFQGLLMMPYGHFFHITCGNHDYGHGGKHNSYRKK